MNEPHAAPKYPLFTPTRLLRSVPLRPLPAAPTDRILFFRCRTFRRHSYFHSKHYTRARVCVSPRGPLRSRRATFTDSFRTIGRNGEIAY